MNSEIASESDILPPLSYQRRLRTAERILARHPIDHGATRLDLPGILFQMAHLTVLQREPCRARPNSRSLHLGICSTNSGRFWTLRARSNHSCDSSRPHGTNLSTGHDTFAPSRFAPSEFSLPLPHVTQYAPPLTEGLLSPPHPLDAPVCLSSLPRSLSKRPSGNTCRHTRSRGIVAMRPSAHAREGQSKSESEGEPTVIKAFPARGGTTHSLSGSRHPRRLS